LTLAAKACSILQSSEHDMGEIEMRTALHRLALLPLLLIALCAAAAPPLPEARPEDAGLSTQRLARFDAMVQRAVEAGDFPGAVVMVARKGKLVYSKAFGMQDKAAGTPMAQDSIFRAFSMTKPIVSVAAMILVEEGRLGLHEPVSKYIPEFKDMKVAVESFDPASGAASFQTVPAKRQITVQDLLRHTSGITYGVFLPRQYQLQKLYAEAKLFEQPNLDVFCKTLAKIPLRYEPGTTWEYGHSTDVLGRVVEVASGQPLDAFIAERILRPLKMVDTAWYVPADKVKRFAQPLPGTEKNWFPEALIDFTKPATLFAGGHGMVTTAGDYLRFSQMLANGGELDGARILGPRTVEFMASDHVLGAGIARGSSYLPGPGYGFGLGFGVRSATGLSEWMGSPGEYFWGGYAGTFFFIDPKEQLVPVMMFQGPEKRQHYRVLFRSLVYQALVD
jgi:CubicO group peptidase (beta-lactamase class C family)